MRRVFDMDIMLTYYLKTMVYFSLSIVVDGPGTDLNHRSHWTFAIHHNAAETGIIMQVQVTDLSKLIYRFD